MIYLSKQIPRCLLLGMLLVGKSISAQDRGSESSAVTDSAVAPALLPAHPGLHHDVVQAPPCDGRYFSTHWRNWDESDTPTSEEPFQIPARVAPYIDNCIDCPDDHPWFFEVGPIALQHDRFEGGKLITKGNNTLLAGYDFQSEMEWGLRFSAGTRCWDCAELEITGLRVQGMRVKSTAKGPFNLNIPVFNPPFGFDDFGNDASLINVRYAVDMGGFEVLWRRWNLLPNCDPCCGIGCAGGCSPVAAGVEFGLRYLNINEEFSIYSQAGPLPAPNGLQDFLYLTHADNHMIGPEIGIQVRSCPVLTFDVLFCSRFAVCANFIDSDARLREQTGLLAFDKSRDNVTCSQVWDTSFYIRMRPSQCLDLRVGYQLLWVNGYAGAPDQFSRDLGRAGQFDGNNGVIFQGPTFLVQFNF